IEGSSPMDEVEIRASERTRIKEITSSSHAAGREAQANYLALETSMSAAEAVGLLAASPKATPTQSYAQRSAAAGGDGQTYSERKAEAAGPEGFVDFGSTPSGVKASHKTGWSKAMAAEGVRLGPNAVKSSAA
ncbi:MAG: hypothetical protein J0I42_12220, partial [Bosea sp.]|nr:hypothetical protein [Bosea sp. (in: a-proteobacteria)]